jgi:hypothetical protein
MVPGSCWLVNSFVVLDISKSLRQEVLKSEAIDGRTCEALAERSSGLEVFLCGMKVGEMMFAVKQEEL